MVGRRRDARAIAGFIPDCVGLFKTLMQDKQLPHRYKLKLGFMIVYLLSPIDIVPDFIPILGMIDDSILVVLVLKSIIKRSGEEKIIKHWPGPKSSLDMILQLTRL